MAIEYFLYTTEYDNILVDRSDTSFTPLPPNTGEINIENSIPRTQPLYYYRESSGTIILSTENEIENYLNSTYPKTDEDSVSYGEFNVYTGDTETTISNLYDTKLDLTGGTISGELRVNDHTYLSKTLNLTEFNNTLPLSGDFWWDGVGLYIQSGSTEINLIPPKGPLKSVQVRQSTQVNNIPTSWTDFSWNSTDIQNDIDVIEHNTTNTERIYVKEDGLYFISYQYQIDDESSTRVRVNNTTVINGSETTGDATAISLPISKSFLVELVGGDFVTMQTLGLANGQDIDAGATMIVVKYDGLKGDKGADGQGSSIIIQNNGANIPNTPHGTLNFDNTLDVTDNGNGSATVSVAPGNALDGLCELVDTNGGQEMNNITPIAMLWDTNEFLDSTTYTHTPGTSPILVNKTGYYEVSYNINGANQRGNRSTTGVQIRWQGSSVYGKTLTANYSRNTSNNDNNNSLPSVTIQLNSGEFIEVVLFRLGDNNSTLTKAGASTVRLKYLGT